MIRINENYLKLQANYLFVTVGKKVKEYQEKNPDAKIIKLGIGDVTRPIVPEVINAMHKAIDEMGNPDTFRGYGPEQGYEFLREKIQKYDYERHGVSIDADEIFVSDGAKCDCGNIGDIFDIGNKVAITDPVYPVYLDTNVMAGRSGDYDEESGKYKDIVYMPCTKDNNFVPELPNERVDMIYLCLPNNPTGTTLSREDLKRFVDYAIENKSVILFDAAYEIFIDDPNVPHSIYEIKGAKECAIEFKSYSKTAGFTGLRCGYVVIPKTVFGYTENGEKVALNGLWNRRTCTKFNGTSYIVQRGAEAIYTDVGQKQILLNVNYYKDNARIIRQGLIDAGFTVFGGENAPYIWLKTPDGINSWEFFDMLLEKVNVVGTPGVGFGPCGEGYFRLTAFGSKENTIEAMERIKKAAKENVFTK